MEAEYLVVYKWLLFLKLWIGMNRVIADLLSFDGFQSEILGIS